MSKLTHSDVLRRADEIAKERYPDGCGATALADIVREAARELGFTTARKQTEKVRNPNEGRHNSLELLPDAEQVEARRICAETTFASFPNSPPCTDKGFVCYRCQDLAAEAVAAQSERTGA